MSKSYIGDVAFTDSVDFTAASATAINKLNLQGGPTGGSIISVDDWCQVSFVGQHNITFNVVGVTNVTMPASGALLSSAGGDGGNLTNLKWTALTGKPTTATGYGIVSIDNVPVGATTASTGRFTTLIATNGSAIGNIQWANVQGTPTTSQDYGIATIDNAVIGSDTPAAGTFTSLNTPNLSADTGAFNDLSVYGTLGAGNISGDGTYITNIQWLNINGTPTNLPDYGITAIDDIPIGQSTPAAGSFSSLTGGICTLGNTTVVTLNSVTPGAAGLVLLGEPNLNSAQAYIGTPFCTNSSVSSSFTASGNGRFYNVTTSTGTITVTLPTASQGSYFIIRKNDSALGKVITSPATQTLLQQGDLMVVEAGPSSTWYAYIIPALPKRAKVGFMTGLSTNQTMNTLWTRVAFDTIDYNYGFMSGTQTWVPPAGTYTLSFSLQLSSGGPVGTELIQPGIYKNGAIYRALGLTYANIPSMTASIVVDANGTDSFELWMWNNCTTVPVLWGDPFRCWFCGG